MEQCSHVGKVFVISRNEVNFLLLVLASIPRCVWFARRSLKIQEYGENYINARLRTWQIFLFDFVIPWKYNYLEAVFV